MTKPKVGIGVITMGLRKLKDYRTGEHLFYVYTDTERKGVAHARNECLHHLYEQGCDYIFVFDDDCYPTNDGWIDYYVDQMEQSGLHFFTLPESFKNPLRCVKEEIGFWDGTLCQFAMYSRTLIENVGYYNNAYDRYGHEDSAYMWRVRRSGLNGPIDGLPSPIRTLAYIHSEDVYGENPESNISAEDKQTYIEKNREIYEKEINSDQIYYPYRQET